MDHLKDQLLTAEDNPAIEGGHSTLASDTAVEQRHPFIRVVTGAAKDDDESAILDGTSPRSVNIQIEDVADNNITATKTHDVTSVDSTSASDVIMVATIVRILGLSPATKEYLQNKYPTLVEFEEFLQLSSKEIKATTMQQNNDGVVSLANMNRRNERVCARFRQEDRAKLILLQRWMTMNQSGGRQINWNALDKDSFNLAFVHKIDEIILGEILAELHLTKLIGPLNEKGVYSPTKFVGKSKYWFQAEKFDINDEDIYEIERFKKWLKGQLDLYLPSDWIDSFRVDSMNRRKIEWRRVLKAVGLDDDALHALEINNVHDFDTLNRMSEKWRITAELNNAGGGASISTDSKEWQKMGIKEEDARHIINFRHWYKIYVAGKSGMNDWTSDFHSKQYNEFVRRHTNPSNPDDFKKPGLFMTMSKGLKTPKEKKEYLDVLQEAAEDGVVNEKQQYYLRQHYEQRREKMELVQEINEGEGDTSFQEHRLQEILDSDSKKGLEDKTKKLMFNQKLYQYVFSAILVYLFCIGLWWTTGYFMNVPDPPDDQNDGYQTAVFIHNILFGLVTAVVVQELGEEQKDTSLYNRFLPIYREELENAKRLRFQSLLTKNTSFSCRNIWYKISGVYKAIKVVFRLALTWFILYSTRYYIFMWIWAGTISLVYGVLNNEAPESVLYATGQTWLAIAVTIGYSYFGLSDTKAPEDKGKGDEKDESKEEGENELTHSTEAETGNNAPMVVSNNLSLIAQLAEAQKEMEAAVEKKDYEAVGSFATKVVELTKKLKEARVGDEGEGSIQYSVL